MEQADIDRSHRVGKPNPTTSTPRGIIVKFTNYRARNRLYKAKTRLKDLDFKGCYINEDLTKARHAIFFGARQLLRDKCILGTWTSDVNVLIKDLSGHIHRVTTENDLSVLKKIILAQLFLLCIAVKLY